MSHGQGLASPIPSFRMSHGGGLASLFVIPDAARRRTSLSYSVIPDVARRRTSLSYSVIPDVAQRQSGIQFFVSGKQNNIHTPTSARPRRSWNCTSTTSNATSVVPPRNQPESLAALLDYFPFPRLRGKVSHHLCREESREMAAGVNAQVVWRKGGKHFASPRRTPTLTLPRTRGRGCVEIFAHHEAVETSRVRH